MQHDAAQLENPMKNQQIAKNRKIIDEFKAALSLPLVISVQKSYFKMMVSANLKPSPKLLALPVPACALVAVREPTSPEL